MHDGRFATLEEVIDHYSTGIEDHPTLEPFLSTPQGPVRYNFTPDEKAALVAFLNTLTDDLVTNDPKFSDPFIN
jgi:cytochrome c peroxidase